MKKRSLQQIEDFYINLGYTKSKLRKVLAEDREYQKMLKEKKQKLSKKIRITRTEKKRYVLATDTDFEILAKCKHLERLNLSKEDRKLVKLIRAQLKQDWRKSLVITLNQLLKKYN